MASSGVSASMEEDFFTKSHSWKNVRKNRNQDAVHAQKRVTVPLNGPWKIALKFNVKQSKNGKVTSNYKASPMDKPLQK